MHKFVDGIRVEISATEEAEVMAQREADAVSTRSEIRKGMSLTFAQLLIGLVSEKWITETDGEAWLDGKLPVQVDALIAGLPPVARFSAKARAKRPAIILRSDGLVTALAAMEGKTDSEMDAFFIKYAQV